VCLAIEKSSTSPSLLRWEGASQWSLLVGGCEPPHMPFPRVDSSPVSPMSLQMILGQPDRPLDRSSPSGLT